VAAVAVALAGSATIVVEASNGGSSAGPPSVPPTRLPGVLVGPAPWSSNVRLLRERLAAIGLPALSVEGTTLHIHQHLDVFVNGKRVTVPAGIGIDELDGFISPLHTHDTSGVVHVESPAIRPFTLAEFFGVWGVPLAHARVYVDGKGAKPGARLEPHQEIAVIFGRAPRRIPTRYDFPYGL
jgi:hypothetical protein